MMLAPIATAERALRAAQAAQLLANGRIRHAQAQDNDRIWEAIADWAAARDQGRRQAPACGWHDASIEASRVIAIAAGAVADPEGAARFASLCRLGRELAIGATTWAVKVDQWQDYCAIYLDAAQRAVAPNHEREAA